MRRLRWLALGLALAPTFLAVGCDNGEVELAAPDPNVKAPAPEAAKADAAKGKNADMSSGDPSDYTR